MTTARVAKAQNGAVPTHPRMKRTSHGLPHSSVRRRHHREMLEELRVTLATFIQDAHDDAAQRSIYELCSAGYTVLRELRTSKAQQLVIGASGAARRCAILSAVRQISLARVELRRMIECVIWFVYFIDHEVEFADFQRNPTRSWDDRSKTPIAAAASAEIGFFFRYASERLSTGNCPRLVESVSRLKTAYATLSTEVHAARGSVGASATLSQAHDPYNDRIAAKVRDEIDQVMTEAVLLVAGTDMNLIGGLSAIDRAWLDWLIGDDAAKAMRALTLGLAR